MNHHTHCVCEDSGAAVLALDQFRIIRVILSCLGYIWSTTDSDEPPNGDEAYEAPSVEAYEGT